MKPARAVLAVLSVFALAVPPSSCRRPDPPEIAAVRTLAAEGRAAEAKAAFDRLPDKTRKGRGDLLWDLGRGILRAHLKSSEPNLRYHALLSLTQMEREEDLPLFREGLQDPSYKVQTAAAEALGDWGDDSYKGALAALLESEDEEARFLAAAILLKYGDLRGRGVLFDVLLKGEDPRNRRKAAAALGEWGPDDKEVSERLKLAVLRDGNLFVRIEALKGLGNRDEAKEALAGLRALKGTNNIFVKVRALAVLSSLGDAEASGELLAYLHDENRQLRLEALLTAGDLGFEEAVPLLAKVMNQEDIPSRAKAVALLADTGDPKYLADMKRIYAEIDDRVLRINLLKTMAEIAPEEDLVFMKDLVPNADPFVEIYAARALCLLYNRYR